MMLRTLSGLRQLRPVWAISAMLVAIATPVVAKATEMTLYVGQVKVLHIEAVDRVAVGNGSLLSTSITKDGHLILLAEGQGDTGLHIWLRNGEERRYQIYIQPSNSSRSAIEISELLESVKGVTVRDVGGLSVLEGEYDPRFEAVVDVILERYPDAINLTRPLQVTQDKMIYFHVVITEFNTTDMSELGINWQTSINGPSGGFGTGVSGSRRVSQANQLSAIQNATPSGDPGLDFLASATFPAYGFFGIATQIASKINFMVEDNRALVLAEPRLSTRSGGKAEFLVGGEVPFQTTNNVGGSNVEFKEFGISLNIEPVVDGFGNIQSSVEVEVSAVDNALGLNDVPGFRTRRASTEISMRDGETLVISGLVDRNLSETVSGVAGLSKIPVLGALFRSTGRENRVSELVIFVTRSSSTLMPRETSKSLSANKT